MSLNWETFSHAWQLTNFINTNSIKKEQIQTIYQSPTSGNFHLWYWR